MGEWKKASPNQRASVVFTFLFTFFFPGGMGEYRESGGVRVSIEC